MGLFDKIGKKGDCSICGGKVGLLDHKLADGYLCKECKKKLSPYFDVSKKNTAAEIGAQLEAREANKARLSAMTPNKIYGDFGVILIDEEHRCFAALPDTSEGLFKDNKAVSSVDDVATKNPDVVEFSAIENVDLDLSITSREEKRTVDDHQESFDPKHFTYMCSFTMRITVDHPYLRDIYVPLSSGNVQIYTEEPRRMSNLGQNLAAWLFDDPELRVENIAALNDCDSLQKFVWGNASGLPDYSYGFRVSLRNKEDVLRYRYYLIMAGEIKRALTGKVE